MSAIHHSLQRYAGLVSSAFALMIGSVAVSADEIAANIRQTDAKKCTATREKIAKLDSLHEIVTPQIRDCDISP